VFSVLQRHTQVHFTHKCASQKALIDQEHKESLATHRLTYIMQTNNLLANALTAVNALIDPNELFPNEIS